VNFVSLLLSLSSDLASSSELLHHGVDLVPVLEAQGCRGVLLADALAVEHEAGGVGLDCFDYLFFSSGGRGREAKGRSREGSERLSIKCFFPPSSSAADKTSRPSVSRSSVPSTGTEARRPRAPCELRAKTDVALEPPKKERIGDISLSFDRLLLLRLTVHALAVGLHQLLELRCLLGLELDQGSVLPCESLA
jgi:hypothetical protein